ncbi:MAG: hypothetical protein WCX79_04750 [Candidatus Paceibacterota bacterium]|jgi:uncharacterized Zn finger protein
MQNPDTGRMEHITEEKYVEAKKEGKAVFRVGEKLQINGGYFRVRKITKKDVIIRGITFTEFSTGK